jgi:hypothetical protein
MKQEPSIPPGNGNGEAALLATQPVAGKRRFIPFTNPATG